MTLFSPLELVQGCKFAAMTSMGGDLVFLNEHCDCVYMLRLVGHGTSPKFFFDLVPMLTAGSGRREKKEATIGPACASCKCAFCAG